MKSDFKITELLLLSLAWKIASASPGMCRPLGKVSETRTIHLLSGAVLLPPLLRITAVDFAGRGSTSPGRRPVSLGVGNDSGPATGTLVIRQVRHGVWYRVVVSSGSDWCMRFWLW